MIPRKPNAFTLIELLVVIAIIALLIVVLLPALSASRRVASQLKNTGQLRSIHQSSLIFAHANGGYLPGLNATGVALASTDAAFSALSGANSGPPFGTGGSVIVGGNEFATRLYILLNGNFIAGDLILSPIDTPSNGGKWTNPAQLPATPTCDYHQAVQTSTGQFSYVLLGIGVTVPHPEYAGEWRDNANSHAVLMCDRDSEENWGNAGVSPRSIWATSSGSVTDWKGGVVWGDNHAEFDTSATGFATRYGANISTNNALFFFTTMGNWSTALFDPIFYGG